MLRAVFFTVLGTVLATSMTIPAVFSFILYLNPGVTWPFSRVYDRVMMFWILVFLIYFRREFNLQDLRRALLRQGPVQAGYGIVFGLLLTTGLTFLFMPYFVSTDRLAWTPYAWTYFSARLPKILIAALLISIIEELFFRVLLFGRLKTAYGVLIGAALSSAVYAFVHFISPVKAFVYTSFDILAGFKYLGLVFERLTLSGIPEAVFGLWLVGLLLCGAYQRIGSVYLCIGLHAGWVMALKMISLATRGSPGADFPEGIGGRYFFVSQPLGWLVIGLVGLVLFFSALSWKRADQNKLS